MTLSADLLRVNCDPLTDRDPLIVDCDPLIVERDTVRLTLSETSKM